MCVVLLISMVLDVDLVIDDMIDWFWKSAFGTMFEVVEWGAMWNFWEKNDSKGVL
jgi:hypothetical protein